MLKATIEPMDVEKIARSILSIKANNKLRVSYYSFVIIFLE